MKYWLALTFDPHSEVLTLARRAEELGFEGVAMNDHVLVPAGEKTPHPDGFPLPADAPFLDPLVTFGAISAVTTSLRLLTFALVLPLRNPVLLAKQLGSLALLSNNRLVVGTGTGWLREEFAAVGAGFDDRGARTDEMLEIMADFWNDGWAEHRGTHYDLPRSGMFPHPTSPIPIWVGGHSMAAARRAARFDGYMPMSSSIDGRLLREFALIDELRAESGRTGAFDRVAVWTGGQEPTAADDLVRHGINNAIVIAWPSDAGVPLAEKLAAAETFSRQVIHT